MGKRSRRKRAGSTILTSGSRFKTMRSAAAFALGAVLVASLKGCSSSDSEDKDKDKDKDEDAAKITCGGRSWEWECVDDKVELAHQCANDKATCEAWMNNGSHNFNSSADWECEDDGKVEMTLKNRNCAAMKKDEECKVLDSEGMWKVCVPGTSGMAMI